MRKVEQLSKEELLKKYLRVPVSIRWMWFGFITSPIWIPLLLVAGIFGLCFIVARKDPRDYVDFQL
jgi:hypothetical protein